MKMNKHQLVQVAKRLGLDINPSMSNAELEAALENIAETSPDAYEQAVQAVLSGAEGTTNKAPAKSLALRGNGKMGKRILRIILSRQVGDEANGAFVSVNGNNRTILYDTETDVPEGIYEALRIATEVRPVVVKQVFKAADGKEVEVSQTVAQQIPRYIFTVIGQVMPDGSVKPLKMNPDKTPVFA